MPDPNRRTPFSELSRALEVLARLPPVSFDIQLVDQVCKQRGGRGRRVSGVGRGGMRARALKSVVGADSMLRRLVHGSIFHALASYRTVRTTPPIPLTSALRVHHHRYTTVTPPLHHRYTTVTPPLRNALQVRHRVASLTRRRVRFKTDEPGEPKLGSFGSVSSGSSNRLSRASKSSHSARRRSSSETGGLSESGAPEREIYELDEAWRCARARATRDARLLLATVHQQHACLHWTAALLASTLTNRRHCPPL